MIEPAETPRPARAVFICRVDDLVRGGGAVALVDGEQVALFYLPDADEPGIFAIGNRDPIADAAVLSRGIVGDVGGELVVASPLYKQHFSLTTGRCLEEPEMSVPVYRVLASDEHVYLVR